METNKRSLALVTVFLFAFPPLVAMEAEQPQDTTQKVTRRKIKKEALLQAQTENLEKQIAQEEPTVEPEELAEIEEAAEQALRESQMLTQQETAATPQTAPLVKAQQKNLTVATSPTKFTKMQYLLSSYLDTVNELYFDKDLISESCVPSLTRNINGALKEISNSLPINHSNAISSYRKKLEAAKTTMPEKIEYQPMEDALKMFKGIVGVPVAGKIKITPDIVLLQIFLQKLKTMNTDQFVFAQKAILLLDEIKEQLLISLLHSFNQHGEAMRTIKEISPTIDTGEISEDYKNIKDLEANIRKINFEANE